MKQSRKPWQGASAPSLSNPAPPASPAVTEGEGEVQGLALGRDPPPPLLSGPAGVGRWLDASRESRLDLLAAAREGARRPRKRVLSRAEMRRQARDAFAQVKAFLDLAAEGLRKAN